MMDVLIDTQSFIWFFENDPHLPVPVRALMEKSDRLIISIASFWEITIKVSLKKLVLSADIASMIDKALFNGFEIMPIKREHLITLSSLEFIHRDPFDRIIIAQAIAEKLPIVSSDSIFKQYSITVIR